ncbi:MAG: peptidoglycan editing factor PgeF [Pseudomonadales bacterium]
MTVTLDTSIRPIKPIKSIKPIWPAPAHVIAGVSTRSGGCSQAPYQSMNLAHHVGDKVDDVTNNRAQLAFAENTSAQQWQWLEQTHSTAIIEVNQVQNQALQADAAFTSQHNTVCTVMTADCLPILLCDAQGTRVAAIHAGWRGLANGVISNSINAFCNQLPIIKSQAIYAWLGPAIGPDHFEVGVDVREAFVNDTATGQLNAAAFEAQANNKYKADIYQLATIALNACGVHSIYGGGFCTVCESERFYSYRREAQTGRMASYIYLDTNQNSAD